MPLRAFLVDILGIQLSLHILQELIKRLREPGVVALKELLAPLLRHMPSRLCLALLTITAIGAAKAIARWHFLNLSHATTKTIHPIAQLHKIYYYRQFIASSFGEF